MSEPFRYLFPLLALLGAAMADAGTVEGFTPAPAPEAATRTTVIEPTDALPRRWELPAGWTTQVSSLPGGGVVEDLRGPEQGAWARVFSWPAPLGLPGAREARRRLLDELRPGYQLARHRSQGEEIELLLVGWTSYQDVRTPDAVALARCARVGERLVAAVGGVELEDPDSSEQGARELLGHLRLVAGP